MFCTLCAVVLSRLTALRALLQSILKAEDVIKVHEARLTEKETTSLDLNEVDRYRNTLKVRHAPRQNTEIPRLLRGYLGEIVILKEV